MTAPTAPPPAAPRRKPAPPRRPPHEAAPRPQARRGRPRPPQGRHPVTTQATRRRLVAFLVGALVVCGLLATRLVFLQASPPAEYTAFGERQLVHKMVLPAARGAIFDRNGQELALSVRQTTIWVNPRQVTDPAAEAEALSPVLGVDVPTLQEKVSRDAAFVYLARTVPDAVADQVKALHLPGIQYIEEPKRFTPAGDLAAPLIGKVGTDNLGLSGLELQFNKTMAGRDGSQVVEQTPAGTPYDGVRQRTPSLRGDDLVLTIDRSLQFETEQALSSEITTAKAKGGIALVMDSNSGEILAMANLVADATGAGPPVPSQNNMALTNVYEPGSVNKLITISGALEEGVVKADEVLSVPGKIQVADHLFSEHDPHPTVQWSVTDIMANSSNVGTIMIGQKLGKDRIDRYLRAYGLGKRTGTGFPGESPGIMLDPKKWSGTSIGTIPIGQGIAVTAVQMLAAYNTVANGGVYVAPKLVKATVDATGKEQPTPASDRHRVISERTAQQVTGMLREVVRVGTGTAAAIDGYTVAGKTGTARKPLEHARGYKAGAYVSSFAGFVPAEKPALTAMVMLDEPTPIYGGLVAAPVFAQISQYGLRQFRIPPPAAALPAVVPAVSPEVARQGNGEPVTGDTGPIDPPPAAANLPAGGTTPQTTP